MTDPKKAEWHVQNGHAGALVASVIFSPDDDNMLVAMVLTDDTLQILDAIKASMSKKRGHDLHITNIKAGTYATDRSYFLTTAGKGYVQVQTGFGKVNAKGHARAHVHPLTLDPRLGDAEHFYIIVPNEAHLDGLNEFGKRLSLGTPHAVLPDWYKYLLETGSNKGLVKALPVIGEDWKCAWRVAKNTLQWEQIISEGLREQLITIERKA